MEKETGKKIDIHIRPADQVSIFFLSLFASLTLLFHNSIESPFKLLIIYTLLLAIQIYLGKISPSKGIGRFIYDIVFPVVMILTVFDTMTELVPGIRSHDIDHLLIRADYFIFRTYPTVWLERFFSPLLTDILQIGYSSYYFLPVFLGIVLKLQGKNKEFDEGITFILLCFFLSYVGYILFPALGPRYAMEHLQSFPMKGSGVYEWVSSILNSIEGIKRDAFPSGHTGISLMVLHLAFRYEKRLLPLFIPLVTLLIIATVYCRYHYAVDVLGGVGLYILTLITGRFIIRRWAKEEDQTDLQPQEIKET
ncbi:MAG: phosphatase PAP2 family protein [Nitrospirae bacterium]|nr:MAG: phosphatase PAP2 family protein [Nitrospirota bacterium]